MIALVAATRWVSGDSDCSGHWRGVAMGWGRVCSREIKPFIFIKTMSF